ncbi:MAG TPA: Ig-like domain-containing protein [Kofleriaceae bacterium]|nr:Ig-like domain-containing protein [Kofleriaceae bacterium]
MKHYLIALSLLLPASLAEAADDAPSVPGASATLMGTWLESPCPGPACDADLQPEHAQGKRITYLVFDGITLTRSTSTDDAVTNRSAIVNSSTEIIPAFNINDLSSTGGYTRAQIIARVIDDLYNLHLPYDIEFVTTRPASGYYSMIVFGGTCETVAGTSCAGIALRDCGDVMPSNITFVFPPNLKISDLATTAAQEAAHAWGLGHTDDRYDVMYPVVQALIPTGYGAGNIMGADGQPDGSGCPSSATYQDSHQKMLTNIGPRGQDTTAPTVTITSPAEGGVISPGELISVDATDNLTVARVDLELGGEVIRTASSAPWEFALSSQTPAGSHLLTARAYDPSGNMGFDRITIYVLSGNETPCQTVNDCNEGETCTDNFCVGPTTTGGQAYDLCTINEDCMSGVCASSGGESRCSEPCTTSDTCPAGGECLSATACWPSNPDDGDGESKSIFACTTGSTTGGGALLGLLLLAGALVISSRPRKR